MTERRRSSAARISHAQAKRMHQCHHGFRRRFAEAREEAGQANEVDRLAPFFEAPARCRRGDCCITHRSMILEACEAEGSPQVGTRFKLSKKCVIKSSEKKNRALDSPTMMRCSLLLTMVAFCSKGAGYGRTTRITGRCHASEVSPHTTGEI
jgi:hypothetical protein